MRADCAVTFGLFLFNYLDRYSIKRRKLAMNQILTTLKVSRLMKTIIEPKRANLGMSVNWSKILGWDRILVAQD